MKYKVFFLGFKKIKNKKAIFFVNFFLKKMSNTLPLTVQDDIEAKERYSNKQRTYCSSRRLRIWTILICVFLSTVALIKYNGIDYKAYSSVMVAEDQVIVTDRMPQISLKQELLNDIEQHPLIVYSKTYCP